MLLSSRSALQEVHRGCLSAPSIAVDCPKMLSPTFPSLTLPGNNPDDPRCCHNPAWKTPWKAHSDPQVLLQCPRKGWCRDGSWGPTAKHTQTVPPCCSPPQNARPRDGSFLLGSAGHMWGCVQYSWEQALPSPGVWRGWFQTFQEWLGGLTLHSLHVSVGWSRLPRCGCGAALGSLKVLWGRLSSQRVLLGQLRTPQGCGGAGWVGAS